MFFLRYAYIIPLNIPTCCSPQGTINKKELSYTFAKNLIIFTHQHLMYGVKESNSKTQSDILRIGMYIDETGS